MGNILRWMWSLQPTEIRVIYVKEHGTEHVFPVAWPDSYLQFVSNLHEIFPAMKHVGKKKLDDTNHTNDQLRFLFKDASEFPVCVVSESTFRGLTPCHKQIAPTVNVYYVSLNSWVVG